MDELVDTLASRLALDVRRMTLTFDPEDPADREEIARLYRHARVLVHETRDGQVSIVADVPRRLLGQLDAREEVNFSECGTSLSDRLPLARPRGRVRAEAVAAAGRHVAAIPGFHRAGRSRGACRARRPPRSTIAAGRFSRPAI